MAVGKQLREAEAPRQGDELVQRSKAYQITAVSRQSVRYCGKGENIDNGNEQSNVAGLLVLKAVICGDWQPHWPRSPVHTATRTSEALSQVAVRI